MGQRVLLDRRRAGSYLALVLLAGCAKPLQPLAPEGMVPVELEQVRGWTEPTVPVGATVYRFKWLYQDERASAGGRGSARVSGPDSVRLDARGPLGSGRSAAVVVGDRIVWVDPPDAVDRLVPSVPLMWAMFGVAVAPGDSAGLQGLTSPAVTAWSYGWTRDTLVYVLEPGRRRFTAELRRDGLIVGRTETVLDSLGRPTSARLSVPSGPARLDLTFTASEASAPFAHDVWHPDST